MRTFALKNAKIISYASVISDTAALIIPDFEVEVYNSDKHKKFTNGSEIEPLVNKKILFFNNNFIGSIVAFKYI